MHYENKVNKKSFKKESTLLLIMHNDYEIENEIYRLQN